MSEITLPTLLRHSAVVLTSPFSIAPMANIMAWWTWKLNQICNLHLWRHLKLFQFQRKHWQTSPNLAQWTVGNQQWNFWKWIQYIYFAADAKFWQSDHLLHLHNQKISCHNRTLLLVYFRTEGTKLTWLSRHFFCMLTILTFRFNISVMLNSSTVRRFSKFL